MDTPIDKNKINVQDINLFKDSPILVYLYKKTEKLVSALYMLSSFISDKEPIKWQMREAGVDLLSQSLSLSDKSSSERLLSYNNFISTTLKFLSFLEVSYSGGVISEMNYKILRFEFESLIQVAESSGKWSDAKGLIFPEHFFEMAQPQVNPISTVVESNLNSQSISKGHKIMSDRMSLRKPVKSNRQEIILSLLKKNKELGIKDFVSSISDCSEKTIQRELVVLVTKGLIRKEGEKRWSRYSLK